jgi:hypothetical protein
MSAWTHTGLRDRAEWLIRDVPEVGDRFAAIAGPDGDLGWHTPYATEDYSAFADRTFDMCSEHDGEAVILAWQWPGRPYVTVLLACPQDGTTTIAITPTTQATN